MADYRQIHTSIWDDDWFCQLSSDEKIVFIWLFSNRRASVSGIYKFAEFICSREIGIPLVSVKLAIKKLIADQKIYIEGEWIWVKNLRKYNDSKSPNSYKRIEADLSLLPNNGMKKAYIAYYKGLASPLPTPTNPPPEQEQEQEKKKKKPATPDIVFPDNLNTTSFMEAWIEWDTFRTEKKCKLTSSTIKKQLAFLAKYPVETAIAIIDKSIERGWQGLFELEKNGNNHNGNGQKPISNARKELLDRI